MEHEERADQLEREADKLEEHSQEVGQRIEDTRSERENPGVPGEDEQATGNPDAAGSEE